MESETKHNGTPDAPAIQEGHAEGKGKGVARGDANQETVRQAGGDSVLSRLGQSATALSKSVVQGTPSVKDLANAASSAKIGASSSSRTLDTLVDNSSKATASSSSGTGEFRSGHTHAHVAAEEAAFSDFLDSTSVSVPAETSGLAKAWEVATSTSITPKSSSASQGAADFSVAEQQARDGVEVVRLLSQSGEEMPEHEGQMNVSEAEFKSLRQALFDDGSPAQTSASDWNNMLNFIPDFLCGQGDRHGRGISESRYMNLGVTDTTEAGQLWLDEWNRVLTSYNDEVWGDLGDLVQQARSEVQRIRDSQEGQTPDPTALRRLQAVLTRVRARL